MDAYREWSFVADMNHDGSVTISDIWLWLKWLYFYLGDFVLYAIISDQQPMAKFLEITSYDYGGVLSAVISLYLWIIYIFLFKEIVENIHSNNKEVIIIYNPNLSRKKREYYKTKIHPILTFMIMSIVIYVIVNFKII